MKEAHSISVFSVLTIVIVLFYCSTSIAEQGRSFRLISGVFVGASYNDFYDTKFGLNGLKSSEEYSLETEGSEDLLGNYWGFGGNVSFSGLLLLSPFLGINANLGLSLRQGTGESNIAVKLFWKEETRQPEKSDLNIEYRAQQLNIDIPITVRLMSQNIFYAEAGPLFSFNLYSYDESTITDSYGSQKYSSKGDVNLFEFGLIFGLGTIRQIGTSTLDFNLRFLLGMTTLTDANDAPKTWQWQFNIGYWFI